MSYKLVAIDLDGTLLNDNKEVSSQNVEVIKALEKKGIEIVIATGRRYWSAKKIISKLDMNITIISNSGNIVRRVKDDRILIEKYLNIEDFNTLVSEGKKLDLHPIVHINSYEDGWDFIIENEINHTKYNNYISPREKRYKKVSNLNEYKENNILVACFLDDFDKLDRFMKSINRRYPNKYSYHIMSKLNKSGPLLEVMSPLGSKWKSLMEYSSSKGIETEEIIAIGDDNNDIEMIKESGLGIAMKNGSYEVKRYSDTISSEDNNNSGVAIELMKIFNV